MVANMLVIMHTCFKAFSVIVPEARHTASPGHPDELTTEKLAIPGTCCSERGSSAEILGAPARTEDASRSPATSG